MDTNNNAKYIYSMVNMIYLLSENYNMDLKAHDSVSISIKLMNVWIIGLCISFTEKWKVAQHN